MENIRAFLKMNKVLCITGMHRSGTSLLASWLEECGLRIYSDNKFMEESPSNPKGHFEDRDFVSLQSERVLSLFPDSRGWKIFEPKDLIFSEKEREEAISIIQQRNEKYGLWGWKDPRTVLFLKEWKRMIPELKVIILWRPLQEVVSSLVRRSLSVNRKSISKIGLFSAAKVWKACNCVACRYKEEYQGDTLLLSLEDVINKDREVLDLIRGRFGINLKYMPITSIYDARLLNKKVMFIAKPFKGAEIEERLKILSDL